MEWGGSKKENIARRNGPTLQRSLTIIREEMI
jgi:hypothetical protein